jgi:DNA-binding transcriptional MocR family regulator
MISLSRPHVMYIVPVGQNPTGSVSTGESQEDQTLADKLRLMFRL